MRVEVENVVRHDLPGRRGYSVVLSVYEDTSRYLLHRALLNGVIEIHADVGEVARLKARVKQLEELFYD